MPDGTFSFPPGTQEAWTKLAQQLPASTGPFAGPGKDTSGTGGTTDGGKQWLRACSLVVYAANSPSPFAPVAPSPSPSSAPAPAPHQRAQPAPGDSPPSTTLDDVKVTAPAPKPASTTQQGDSGAGIELSALRVTFNVHVSTSTTPSELDARIYNLSPGTMKKVFQFGRVKLMAGYKYAQYGVIFDGQVVQYRRGKENPTDTYLEIKAMDGDKLSQAITARRHEAGETERDALKKMIESDVKMPVGYMSPKIGTQTLVRPWVLCGPTQKYIRDMMLKYNAQCFPDKGTLQVVEQRDYVDGEKVVLKPSTGLVGIPEATPEGIQIRCLLNPRIKIGGLVQLDKELISGVAFIPGGDEITPENQQAARVPNEQKGQKVEVPVPTSPTGTYKVFMIEYTGDNRGQPWYCDLICLGLDGNGNVMNTPGSVFARQGDQTKPSTTQQPAAPPEKPPASGDGVPALDPSHPPPT